MKGIVADKIISLLDANEIPYEKVGDLISFFITNQNKGVRIFYKNPRFYIDENDYVGQPHIITHWNPKNQDGKKDNRKYGLCLTMNGSDRRDNTLIPSSQLKRVKEIVFELWADPIQERFNELNVYYGTRKNSEYYINYNGEVLESSSGKSISTNIEILKLQFTGQTKQELFNIIQKQGFQHEWILVYFNYENENKKMLISPKKKFDKLDDFTKESFWGRTDKVKMSKKVIIVGVGSIGGLVLDFLCKAGFDDITIFDKDEMSVINNTRHVLGIAPNQIGINKAEHMANHYSKLYPMIKIQAINKNFQYKENIECDTLIFNTTGGSHSQLVASFVNLFCANKKTKWKLIDISIEPFALAIHAVVMDSFIKENIEKMFTFEKNERYLVTNKKDFRKSFDGCFTPTLPYGFTPLQIGVPWLITKLLKDNFKTNHYTIPFLSLFPDKKEILNEELSREINPYRIGVKLWKK